MSRPSMEQLNEMYAVATSQQSSILERVSAMVGLNAFEVNEIRNVLEAFGQSMTSLAEAINRIDKHMTALEGRIAALEKIKETSRADAGLQTAENVDDH